MHPFAYVRADSVAAAVQAAARNPGARFIAGGTNLIDLMKENVARPAELIDITRLPLDSITDTPDGGVRIGALTTNATVAYDARMEARYPVLSKAILAGASAQLRNMASSGGNLLQRTRCYYFYDVAVPCNKREPGSGCSAIEGVNRIHAILGASEHCIATHPSDMCVALAALDAQVRVTGPAGDRVIAMGDFHRLPGSTPHIDTVLEPGELITAIDLPPRGFADHHAYLKIRDRASFAFALVSVAAALEVDGGAIVDARLALGGVAHKPWRDAEAEASMRGRPANAETYRAAAALALRGARVERLPGRIVLDRVKDRVPGVVAVDRLEAGREDAPDVAEDCVVCGRDSCHA
jgi:xanthine dehydrogenase YagS FAD-binding subunit